MPHRHLANAVQYILDEKNNEAKTCDGLYVGGNAGYDSEDIIKTFLNTKELYGKLHGRQGYHFVISFEPGETDADEASLLSWERGLKSDCRRVISSFRRRSSRGKRGLKYYVLTATMWTVEVAPLVGE